MKFRPETERLKSKKIRGALMRFDLLALYGGPDQVMTVTSGLASVLGLLLLFWNKVVGIFFKIVRMFRRSDTPGTPEASKDAPKGTL
jgi:type IV secretory pathway TrbD component